MNYRSVNGIDTIYIDGEELEKRFAQAPYSTI